MVQAVAIPDLADMVQYLYPEIIKKNYRRDIKELPTTEWN
jgi:hypothetical protein